MKTYLPRAPIRILAFTVIFAMLATLLPAIPQEASAATMPSNPRLGDSEVTWDCVYFGSYPQGANGEPEKIKWRVLSVNGDEALLLADKNLDCKKYNETYADVTWETSTIRSWLNGYGIGSNADGKDCTSDNFIGKAFTASEQGTINQKTIQNPNNPEYGTIGGNDTTDKVFLLSLDEVMNPDYGFSSNYSEWSKTRWAKNTDYAKMQGAYTHNGGKYDSGEYDGNSWWWLRSPGDDSSRAAIVNVYGNVHRSGFNGSHAVRPALFLNLKSDQWSNAGTVSSEGKVEEINPHILSLIPESGYRYVELTQLQCCIDFDKEINITGTGHAYLMSYDTDKVVKEIDISANSSDSFVVLGRNKKSNRLTLNFKRTYNDETKLSKDTKYYVLLDPGIIEFWNYDKNNGEGATLGETFSGIQNKEIWNFRTTSTEYSHIRNLSVAGEIDSDLYDVLWKPLTARWIQKHKSNGSKGICFGLAYAAGAWKEAFQAIRSIGGDSALADLNKDTKGTSQYDFLKYLQLAYLYQYTDQSSGEFKRNKNQYDKLYKAIDAYQKGQGRPIILGVHNDTGGHALMPLGIISENGTTIEIAVYDCNGYGDYDAGDRGDYIRKFTLEKEGDRISKWNYHKEYGTQCAGWFDFGYIDNVLDNVVMLDSAQKESKNLVVSSVQLSNDNLVALNQFGAEDNMASQDRGYDYWTDENCLTRNAINSTDPAELSITDGQKEVYVSAALNANVTVDLGTKSSQLDFDQSSENNSYNVVYRTADEKEILETISITGNASSKTATEETKDGIVLSSDDLKDVKITKENSAGVESAIVTSAKNEILIGEKAGGLAIYEDGNGDGEYDTLIGVDKPMEPPTNPENPPTSDPTGGDSQTGGLGGASTDPSTDVTSSTEDGTSSGGSNRNPTDSKNPSGNANTKADNDLSNSQKANLETKSLGKVVGVKVKASKKKLTVKWKRNKKASGYQVMIATDRKFKKNKKTATIKKNKTVTKTFTKLKRKKTYFAKVRVYKQVGKTKVYGAYSKVKKAKVK